MDVFRIDRLLQQLFEWYPANRLRKGILKQFICEEEVFKVDLACSNAPNAVDEQLVLDPCRQGPLSSRSRSVPSVVRDTLCQIGYRTGASAHARCLFFSMFSHVLTWYLVPTHVYYT